MSLSTYLAEYMGGLESAITVDYDFVVSETLRAYGVETEAEATDITKLYKLGVYFLWLTVQREVSFDIDFSGDGVTLKRSMVYDHVTQLLQQAYSDCIQYLTNYKITKVNSARLTHCSGSLVDDFYMRTYYRNS